MITMIRTWPDAAQYNSPVETKRLNPAYKTPATPANNPAMTNAISLYCVVLYPMALRRGSFSDADQHVTELRAHDATQCEIRKQKKYKDEEKSSRIVFKSNLQRKNLNSRSGNASQSIRSPVTSVQRSATAYIIWLKASVNMRK
jgi:hypothetical protein